MFENLITQYIIGSEVGFNEKVRKFARNLHKKLVSSLHIADIAIGNNNLTKKEES